MNSVNVRWEDELIRFDCPHCGVDGEVDEATLRAVWAIDGEGIVTCPEPNGCQMKYILPTLEELDAHKASIQSANINLETAPVVESEKSPVISMPITDSTAVASPTVKIEPLIKRQVSPVSQVQHTVHSRMKMAIRTFRHMDYKQNGQDLFDQSVSDFLEQQSSANIVSVSPISYMDRDDKLVDYGVMVVFRKPIATSDTPTEKQEWRD